MGVLEINELCRCRDNLKINKLYISNDTLEFCNADSSIVNESCPIVVPKGVAYDVCYLKDICSVTAGYFRYDIDIKGRVVSFEPEFSFPSYACVDGLSANIVRIGFMDGLMLVGIHIHSISFTLFVDEGVGCIGGWCYDYGDWEHGAIDGKMRNGGIVARNIMLHGRDIRAEFLSFEGLENVYGAYDSFI